MLAARPKVPEQGVERATALFHRSAGQVCTNTHEHETGSRCECGPALGFNPHALFAGKFPRRNPFQGEGRFSLYLQRHDSRRPSFKGVQISPESRATDVSLCGETLPGTGHHSIRQSCQGRQPSEPCRVTGFMPTALSAAAPKTQKKPALHQSRRTDKPQKNRTRHSHQWASSQRLSGGGVDFGASGCAGLTQNALPRPVLRVKPFVTVHNECRRNKKHQFSVARLRSR